MIRTAGFPCARAVHHLARGRAPGDLTRYQPVGEGPEAVALASLGATAWETSRDGRGSPVSSLGPFIVPGGPSSEPLETALRRATRAAGMLWLEPDALRAELPGLIVEHDCERRVWTVGE